MKYQITCDNCGTQFIIEAEQGQTVECKCPHCHGVMDITLPLVTGARQYGEQPVKNIQSGNFRPQPMSKSSGPEKRRPYRSYRSYRWPRVGWSGNRCLFPVRSEA